MFRLAGSEAEEAIAGLLEADAWRAEEVSSALRSLAHEETLFVMDELLGWYSDLRGPDEDVERALTRLMTLVIVGDLDVIAAAIKRAVNLRRALERVLATDAREAA